MNVEDFGDKDSNDKTCVLSDHVLDIHKTTKH